MIKHLLSALLLAAAATGLPPAVARAQAGIDFGPNVAIFDPSMTRQSIQAQFDSLFREQEKSQFGPARYALLFKPGAYTVDANVGFYTQVSGLGLLPDDVTINGWVRAEADWSGDNGTVNFWRDAENMAINPPGGKDRWAVSQASPFRRMHISVAKYLIRSLIGEDRMVGIDAPRAYRTVTADEDPMVPAARQADEEGLKAVHINNADEGFAFNEHMIDGGGAGGGGLVRSVFVLPVSTFDGFRKVAVDREGFSNRHPANREVKGLLGDEEGDVVLAGATFPIAYGDKETVGARLRGSLDGYGGILRARDAFRE